MLEVGGQLEGSLAAELDDDAEGSLGVADREHVLTVEWIEVEAIHCVVVGGDGLRVAVDHHRLESLGAQPGHRLDAAGVELDALADAHRPTAEDEHRAAWGGLLVAVTKAAVEVGSPGLELGCAGVHPTPDPPLPTIDSPAAEDRGLDAGQTGEVVVGETQELDGIEHAGFLDPCHDFLLGRYQGSDSAQEPGVNGGQIEDLLQAPPPAQRFGGLPQTVRRRLGETPLELGVVRAADLGRRLERVTPPRTSAPSPPPHRPPSWPCRGSARRPGISRTRNGES